MIQPWDNGSNEKRNKLSRERCNVSSDIVSVPPTHRKIHLRMRASERSHEIILIKSIFSTNHLKRRRVCDDAPRTPANKVTCGASFLSYMPATLNIPGEGHSRHRQQRDGSSKTNSIALHKDPPFLIRARNVPQGRSPPVSLPDRAGRAAR
jgi:hypothetical protein